MEKDFKDRDVKKDTTLTIRTVPGEDDVKSAGAFYLSGNTKSDNLYDAKEGAMTVAQPIEISEVLFFEASNSDDIKSLPEGFYPVIDSLSNNIDIALHYYNNSGFGAFVIYTKSQNEERPYVSNIFAIDQLTLFRDNGGTEAGLTADLITEDKLYAYLTSKGATQVISYSANTNATNIWGSLFGALDHINMTKFGYTRTAKTSKALRDVFLYFNEFSTDEPPKEIYRGSVKYTMLCEIPYNLLGFADAPSAGVYLYGATSSKAGERIVDLQISSLPFMDGYETVRTMGGRSLMSEIKDYAKHQQSVNPVEESKAFFEALYSFFDNDDGKMQAPYYYLHIKREKDTSGDDLYIKQLYLASANKDWGTLLETLFDQGAEGCIEVNLNADTVGETIYLGYSYTSKVDEALKEIRAYHSKSHPTTMTDDDGNVFTLVSDLDLNKGAGGNYIYLYTSKTSTTQNPITDVSVAFKVTTITRGVKTASGEIITTQTQATKQWDSSKNSDLNKGAGGEYVYLMYTTTSQKVDGTPAKVPN